MQVIIDRFEGEYAIVEIDLNKFAKISKSLLPESQEGDVINITINKEETKKRNESVSSLVNDLFED